jgi:hypothetical protein
MEQSPSCEANSHSASQEILCLLWNTKVCYHVHKSATGHYPEVDESSLTQRIMLVNLLCHTHMVLEP